MKIELLAAVALSFGVAVGGAALFDLGPNKTVEALPGNEDTQVAMNDPFVTPCNGTQTTIADVRADIPFKLFRSHHSLANDSNLIAAWDCPGPQIALEYASGVMVYLSPNTYDNPSDVWATMAATYPEFSVGVSRGKPASLINPAKSPNGTAAGGVDLVEGNIRVTVLGNGKIPLDDLKEMTESLRQEN